MVVWLFAGGGESEVKGLIPFLEKHFAACIFERKTPVRRKPGPKPTTAYGHTGKSLANVLQKQLKAALNRGQPCDLILVVDDLDCHDEQQRQELFLETINNVEGTMSIKKFIGFAAPEMEAWLIADWDNTIAEDRDSRRCHPGMRWWLSHEKDVPFDQPETFSSYDDHKNSCAQKLSDTIIEAAIKEGQRYSKAEHTPRLLQKSDPQIISQKCPLFRQLHTYLSDFCQQP